MIDAGALVEVSDAGYPEWVRVVERYQDSATVQGTDGYERELPLSQLGWLIPGAELNSLDALNSFLDEVDAAAPAFTPHLAELWQIATDQGITDPAELRRAWALEPVGAKKLLGDQVPEPVAICALCSALRDDPTYFVWDSSALTPAPAAEVERWLSWRQRATLRRQARAAVTQAAAAALNAPADAEHLTQALAQALQLPLQPPPTQQAQHRPSDPPDNAGHSSATLGAQLALLASGVGLGDDADELEELLDDIEAQADRQLPAWPSRAFGLLRLAGVFHPLENLARWRHRWPSSFSEDALAHARAALSSPPAYELPRSGRLLLTIDGDETDEFDDAFSATYLEDGGLEIGVHISHPPALFSLKDPVGRAALERATSLYLPDELVPMLPDEAVRALSLDAGRWRPALSLYARLNEAHRPVSTRWALEQVCVRANLRWPEVDSRLESGERDLITAALRDLYTAAMELEQLRREAGAVILELPEVRFRARGGAPVECEHLPWQDSARRMVEELMIFYSSQAGEALKAAALPALYRTQPRPRVSLSERHLEHREDRFAASFELVRRLQAASWGPSPGAHGGIGARAYVQATSPLRRMVDWYAQISLAAMVSGRPIPESEQLSPEQVTAMLDRLGAGAEIRREGDKTWGVAWLERQRGVELEAMVLNDGGAGRQRAQVVLIHSLQRGELTLKGPFEFGQRVSVKVVATDPARNTVSLSVA